MQVTHNNKNSLKSERMQIRIDFDSYNILKQAASFSHETLSSFIKNVSLIKAKEIINEHENIYLSKDDWSKFLEVLENPPLPNENLKNALKKYRKSAGHA
ncbi:MULTISPECIES: DUF1778 domain-containing protein [unclassified Rickettsia]|uniref:type II toxin-antitoxin system TacA family antitoxin n=1 Tax=unclassified Rickettsia TaxID=114295 RepID=UPI00209EE588|nr:DUF1778 domain-containing protein [Rickettsia endosymbiont of Ceutorhynchus assimilis]